MPTSVKLDKAELRQVDGDGNPVNPEKSVKVQFNPESLKVSYANQIQSPSGAGDQGGTPARQFVGKGTTKLTLQLWFDVTQPPPDGQQQEKDVRKLTEKVVYFITPKKEGDKFVPPIVRFIWGSFQFDGLMDGLEESLEFFSSDGRPLRASMTLNMSQQKIAFDFNKDKKAGPARQPLPGTRPLARAAAGETVQDMADKQGKGQDWQSIAAANNIENPRLLEPGQLLDLNASAGGGTSVGGVIAGAGGQAGAAVPGGGLVQTGVSVQADASALF